MHFQKLNRFNYLMYITFKLQRGIGEVAKEMCFGEDICLKFAYLDAREGERWSINAEEQLKHQFTKSFENVDCTQGINHSRFHYCIYGIFIFITIKISGVIIYLETCKLIKTCEKISEQCLKTSRIKQSI